MAEWLGRGLQNLLQRFNSASGLEERGCLESRDSPFSCCTAFADYARTQRILRSVFRPRHAPVHPERQPASGLFFLVLPNGIFRSDFSPAPAAQQPAREKQRQRHAGCDQPIERNTPGQMHDPELDNPQQQQSQHGSRQEPELPAPPRPRRDGHRAGTSRQRAR